MLLGPVPVPGSPVPQVRRRAKVAGLRGCFTEYQVWVERKEQTVIYVPLVLRNYGMAVASESPAAEPAGSMISPSGVISHTCPDAYEADDTWQQARAIESGVVQVHSFDSDPTYYAADKDFVSFELKADRTITFTVTPVGGTSTLLELYNANGEALNVQGTTQLVWTPSSGGQYYLSVSPQNSVFGCAAGYNLLAEVEPIRYIYLPVVLRSYR